MHQRERFRVFNNFENIRIFRRILITYILILVIPLISGQVIYQVSIHKMEENATEKSEILLNQTKNMIDRKSEELESIIYQISLNSEINQLIYKNKDIHSNSTYDIYKIINSIKPYGYTNTLLQKFYIYFNEIDTIVTPRSSYIRTKDFYENHMYLDRTYEDWMENINQAYHFQEYLPSTQMKIGNTNQEMITYIQSLPLDSTKKAKANIIVLLDEEEFKAPLHQISAQYDGATFIHDDEGNIIVSDNMKESMVSFDQSTKKFSMVDNEEDFIMIESKSNHNTWTYVAMISQDRLAEDIMHITKINYAVSIITIIIGLCIAIVFSHRHSIPLRNLLGIMNIPKTKVMKNPYDFIHSNVEEIIANNDRLQGQIKDQQPILEDMVIRKLVTGEILSTKDAVALIDQARVSLHGNFGYVGIVQIINVFNVADSDILNEMNIAQLVIQNELNDIFKKGIVYCSFDVDQVLFLVTYDQKPAPKEEKKLEENLALLLNRLKEKYSLSVNIGLGTEFDQLIDIHQSYEEAKFSLPLVQSIDDGASIYKYKDHSDEEKFSFYYPVELEIRLINAVMNGSIEEVVELMDKVLYENIEKRNLAQQVGTQMLAALNGTIMRLLTRNILLEQVIIDDIHVRIENIISKRIEFTSDFKEIKEIMIEITQNIHEKKSSDSQRVIDMIKEVVQNNFSDSNLSLHNISEMINVPEKMIPIMFREHAGMNISDYIESTRLSFARSMLQQTEDRIEDIAERSGYNSSHSFRRAFKRSTGLSPSEFRKLIKSERNSEK